MLPSKKTGILIVLVVLCFGLWIGWNYYVSLQDNNREETRENMAQNTQQSSQDTDNDGLEDWQENLYNTNIRVVDTDGDGISDGEEVAGGYDPAVYGQGVDIAVEPTKPLFEDSVLTILQPERTEPIRNEQTGVAQPTVYEKYVPILNDMAEAIITYPVLVATDNDTFNKLFTPNGSIDDELPRFKKIIENYRLVASELDGLPNKAGLELEIIRLVQGYTRVADALDRLLAAYPTYKDNEAEYVNAVIEYSNAVVSLQRQLYAVTEFVYAKSIKFKSGDAGSLFLFGG